MKENVILQLKARVFSMLMLSLHCNNSNIPMGHVQNSGFQMKSPLIIKKNRLSHLYQFLNATESRNFILPEYSLLCTISMKNHLMKTLKTSRKP